MKRRVRSLWDVGYPKWVAREVEVDTEGISVEEAVREALEGDLAPGGVLAGASLLGIVDAETDEELDLPPFGMRGSFPGN